MAKTNWVQEGKKAGKTDGWMRIDEQTLSESLERHPQFARDIFELIQTEIDGWEETDHFQIKYGADMLHDARDKNGELDVDKYQDYKEAFWEGYLSGAASIGKDPYAIAKKLIAGKSKKKSTKKSVKKNPLNSGLSGLR